MSPRPGSSVAALVDEAFGRVDREIAGWAARELLPWRGVELPRPAFDRELTELSTRDDKIGAIRIENGRARIDPEIGALHPNLLDPLDPWGGARIASYVRHFDDAMRVYGVVGEGVVALHLDDLHKSFVDFPVLSFQKRRGSRAILIPDVDFLSFDYYQDEADDFIDATPFAEKQPRAIFVGSTTGDVVLTPTHVARLSNNRLRAAVRFRDEPKVVFELPSIVQCLDQATIDMVGALDVAGRFRGWREQLGYRYLLSMDGNGATCSRVVLSLLSNSVLLKYNSPNLLYYFHGLNPWEHYLPIAADEEVVALLAEEERLAKRLDDVNTGASRFAATMLSRHSVLRYTAETLAGYLALFGRLEAGPKPRDAAFLLDVAAHVAGVGTVRADPGAWIGPAAGGRQIQGIRITPAPPIARSALRYRITGEGGEWIDGGRFGRGAGPDAAIRALEIVLDREAAPAAHLRYRARFADGEETRWVGSGAVLANPTGLVDLQVELSPKRRSRFPFLAR